MKFNFKIQPMNHHFSPHTHNKKTVSEDALKETQTNNDIDYITMMDDTDKTVLDYLLSSEQGEINNKKLKIGEKTYNFQRNKPLTQRLKTQFNKIRQTIELKEKRGKKWVDLDKNKALIGIQKDTRQQSPTNSQRSISNIKVQGVKALQYLKFQDFKRKQYLQKHKGMKVFLETFNTFKSKKTNEEVRHSVRSRK